MEFCILLGKASRDISTENIEHMLSSHCVWKVNLLTWWPTSHMILSSGVLNTWWRATVSSTTPKLELRCPPVFDTLCTISALSSAASCSRSWNTKWTKPKTIHKKHRRKLLNLVGNWEGRNPLNKIIWPPWWLMSSPGWRGFSCGLDNWLCLVVVWEVFLRWILSSTLRPFLFWSSCSLPHHLKYLRHKLSSRTVKHHPGSTAISPSITMTMTMAANPHQNHQNMNHLNDPKPKTTTISYNNLYVHIKRNCTKTWNPNGCNSQQNVRGHLFSATEAWPWSFQTWRDGWVCSNHTRGNRHSWEKREEGCEGLESGDEYNL